MAHHGWTYTEIGDRASTSSLRKYCRVRFSPCNIFFFSLVQLRQKGRSRHSKVHAALPMPPLDQTSPQATNVRCSLFLVDPRGAERRASCEGPIASLPAESSRGRCAPLGSTASTCPKKHSCPSQQLQREPCGRVTSCAWMKRHHWLGN